jgi:O-antigen/teichoic acid export membrane protein
VTLAVSIILVVFADFIAAAFFDGDVLIVRISGLVILVWSLDLVLLSLFRAFRQMKRYSIITIADVYGQLGLIAYLVLNGYGILSAVLAVLAVKVLVFFILFSLVKLQIGIRVPHFHRVREYLSFGLPTISGNIADWVVSSCNRYVIGYFLGVASVGIYSAAYSLGAIPFMLAGVFGFVLPPTLSKLYDEGRMDEVKTHLSYSLKYWLVVAIPFVFGAAVLAETVLRLFSTAEIASQGYFVIPLLALGILFYGAYIVVGHILVLVKKTKTIGLIWVATAGVNLALNIIVVSYIGILGAALATLIAYILAFSVGSYYSFKEFKFPTDWYFIIKSLIASAVMVLVIWFIHPQSSLATILTVILGVIVYGVVLFLLRGFTKKEISFFRRLLPLGAPTAGSNSGKTEE